MISSKQIAIDHLKQFAPGYEFTLHQLRADTGLAPSTIYGIMSGLSKKMHITLIGKKGAFAASSRYRTTYRLFEIGLPGYGVPDVESVFPDWISQNQEQRLHAAPLNDIQWIGIVKSIFLNSYRTSNPITLRGSSLGGNSANVASRY